MKESAPMEGHQLSCRKCGSGISQHTAFFHRDEYFCTRCRPSGATWVSASPSITRMFQIFAGMFGS
jgi:hypothetical protein